MTTRLFKRLTVCISIAGFTVCLWTSGCTDQQRQPKDDYIVAAWVWTSCHDDERGNVNAFVHAPNSGKMNFYLMWANHHITGSLLNICKYPSDTLIWNGTVDWDDYKNVVAHVISHFFRQPNYFKMNK
ncbi:MAG: hypothetical protein LBS43_10360 [Prevotellaceae bacterium]|jgi:hypothetical protein|nr:hypothetical protein [Prevotellaceae bacterium]